MASPEQMSEMYTALQFGSNFGDKTTPYISEWIAKVRQEQPTLVELFRRTFEQAKSDGYGYEYKQYNYAVLFGYDYWTHKNGESGNKVTVSDIDIKQYNQERLLHLSNLDGYDVDQLTKLAPELFDVFSQASPAFVHGMIDVLRPLDLARQRLISTSN